MSKYFFIFFFFIIISSSSQELSNSQEQLKKFTKKAYSYFELGNLDSSMIYCNRGLVLATNLNDSNTLSILTRKQANVFELRGQFSASLAAYLKSINYANHIGQTNELGLSYLGLSNVNYRIYNLESAMSNSIEASNIFKSLNDTSNYISASLLTAQVFFGLEKYVDAKIIIDDMLELAKLSNDSLQWANTLNYLGTFYSFYEEYERALIFFQQASELNSKLKNGINEGVNLGNIGEMYMRMGQYQSAFNALFQALEIEQKQKFNSGIVFLYYTIGETYSKISNGSLALEYFNKSIELIDTLGEIREKPLVYKLIAEHYARNGKYKEAYAYHKSLNAAKDSLAKLTAFFKMEELLAKFEIDKKERDFELLLNEKQIQDQKLTANKNIIKLQLILILIVLIGLISSVIFTIYFFKSRKELKSTNKTKDILFSIIGHDLRGPMGNIIQIVDAIQSHDLPDREKYIQMLKQPSEASFILLEDLLAWSRTLDNKATFNPRLIPINETINKTFSLFNSQADKKSIQLKSLVPNDVLVFAEYNHFSTILRNLVSNALKFTPEHGTITISHKCDKKMIKLFVTDTGIGIEPQNIKKILNKNSFFTTFGTNNEKGSGLGLLLCQVFVKINGGEFEVESELGRGSTFSFKLPATSK